MASLVMLLVAVALLSAITTMHFAIHGAEVQVPALKGMTVADARSQAAGMGLNLDVDNRYYSADVAAGHILSQSPAPGTVVRREWRVRVAESLGPQKVDVPDTVGADERVAALAPAPRRPGSGRHRAAARCRRARGHGAGAGSARPRAGHRAAQREPAGGRAGRRYARTDTSCPTSPASRSSPRRLMLSKVGIKTAPPTFVDVPVPPVGAAMRRPSLPSRPGP